MVPFFSPPRLPPRPCPACFAEAGACSLENTAAAASCHSRGAQDAGCPASPGRPPRRASGLYSSHGALAERHGFSLGTGGGCSAPSPGRRVPPCPLPVGSCLAEANLGAVRGLFPVLPSPSDFCLSACERSFIGLFDVAETRTVQTFIKTLPCGPWDYEY